MTTAELQEFLPDAVRALADRQDAGAVRISKTKDGIEVRLIEKPLFIFLDELSDQFHSKPSVRVLKKTCKELGVKVGRIGAKPCVSIEAFRKALGG